MKKRWGVITVAVLFLSVSCGVNYPHASTTVQAGQFALGMHFHRVFNGLGSPLPTFRYSVVRDWDIQLIRIWEIWKDNGTITGALDFTLIDQVYSSHAQHGAKMIKVFSGVPTWAAKRPTEADPHPFPGIPGRRSGPASLEAYELMVYNFVSHTKQYLWAVEGENEPYACTTDYKFFFSGSATELADIQKRLYRATKRVDPKILVFSPAQYLICGIESFLQAKTSEGEPISLFFDVLAFHLYETSADSMGPIGGSYESSIAQIKQIAAAAGIPEKMLADTEHGWGTTGAGAPFHGLTDGQKSVVIYETTKVARENGLVFLGWYSYESDLVGTPMNNPTLSQGLDMAFSDFATLGPGK
ncbi:MAG: hypothetical protein AABZ39_17835 [Spirochaetota bacterium]